MIKVLLVDDHELVRMGVEALLNAQDNISVIGVADSGEQAVSLVQKLHPEVILLDINMPGIGGVEACRRILQRYPEVKVIALSVHNDGPVPQQLLKLGAKGFLSKDSGVDEMVLAIQNVMHGKHYICPKVASNLALSAIPGNEQSPFERLSQREMEVVNLTLEGKTIREISTMLAIGEKTVNTYRYRVYEKLKVKNDVEMTRLAIKYRYIEP